MSALDRLREALDLEGEHTIDVDEHLRLIAAELARQAAARGAQPQLHLD